MRKDVKLIVGIGCIVLVALLAYALFVPSSKSKQLADETTAATGSHATGGTSPSSSTGAQNSNPSTTAPPIDVVTNANPATQPANNPISVTLGGSTTQPAGGTVVGSTGSPSSTPVVAGTDSNVALGSTPAASTDWAATLNGGTVSTATGSGSSSSTAGGSAGVPANTLIAMTDTSSSGRGSWSSVLGGAGSGAGPSSRPSGISTMSPGTRTHKVQAGETLSSIAAEVYGNRGAYQKIVSANPGINPNRLKVGTVLVIPAAGDNNGTSSSTAADTAAKGTKGSTAGAASGNTYVVKAGDSLQRIATKLYGSSDKWMKIYEANRQTIGGDPHRLRAGMTLKLPEGATSGATATRASSR